MKLQDPVAWGFLVELGMLSRQADFSVNWKLQQRLPGAQ